MNLQKGFAHFLVLVIVIAIVLAGGWFYSNNQPSEQKSISDLTPIPTANPELIKDWETYVNPRHGLTFKYPSDWFVSETESKFPISLAITPDTYSTEIRLPGVAWRQDGVYVNLSWDIGSNSRPKRRFKSISEAINNQIEMMDKKSLVRNDFEIAGKKAVTIQGKIQVGDLRVDNRPYHTTYIQLEDNVLKFSLTGDHEETYNLILSTLVIPENLVVDAVNVDRYCTQDSECWCYEFDGAVVNFNELLDSLCDLERNRCVDCAYR